MTRPLAVRARTGRVAVVVAGGLLAGTGLSIGGPATAATTQTGAATTQTGAVAARAGAVAALPDATIALVSRQLTGGPSNSESAGATEISDDGRWVLFGSDGVGLDPKVSTNPAAVVLPYLLDRRTGTIRMVGTDSRGRVPDLTSRPGFGPIFNSHLSGDGRWLVMSNVARDLLPPWVSTQPRPDLAVQQFFVIKDLVTGVARPVRFPRVTIDGRQIQSTGTVHLISCDGRVIAVSVLIARKRGNEVVASSMALTYDRVTERWRTLVGPTDPERGGVGVRKLSGDARYYSCGSAGSRCGG